MGRWFLFKELYAANGTACRNAGSSVDRLNRANAQTILNGRHCRLPAFFIVFPATRGLGGIQWPALASNSGG